MTNPSTPESSTPDGPSPIEGIRKRPSMYVGSTGFFGLIHYLVGPVALLLTREPSRIDVTLKDASFEVESDGKPLLKLAEDGRITPFESFEDPVNGHGYEGCVLNALSRSLIVLAADASSSRTISYECGRRINHELSMDIGLVTRLSFTPDPSIFTVCELSPAIFESYLRRLSYLHPKVRFSVTYADQSREFAAPGGIRDLFDSISAPYQLLHTPVHITAMSGRLRLELVFAYQSWVQSSLCCFVNNGRAVEGGTHEYGLLRALDLLYIGLKLARKPKRQRNGVVGVMSIYYPEVVWYGAVRHRICSPELVEMVSDLVVTNVMCWVARHPDVAHQLTQLETFQFPDSWRD